MGRSSTLSNCVSLRSMTSIPSSVSDVLWRFTDVDFAKVAESVGCFGIRVERPSEIQGALEQAFASGRPAVVDVVTDPHDSLAPVPWSP